MKRNLKSSLAKLTRTTFSGIYQREHLFQILDNNANKPVIWISGPPGCGKTTLISSYIDSRKLSNLWYQIDEDDKDIATFFHYMGLAGKKASPRRKKPLPHLTPEYLPGLPTFTRRYFQDLYSRIKTPFFLVLDNYQEVETESHLHEVIAGALSEVPEGGSVIIISRSEPPPNLARLIVNQTMEVIGWDKLRLTPKESDEIIQSKARCNLSEETICELHKKSDGWIGGLVLMLNMLEAELVDELKTHNCFTPKEIFDYFTTELFNKTNKKHQDFLLKTAYFPEIEPNTAKKLTGNENSSEILNNLCGKNFFTHKSVGAHRVYRYHPLFREFLQKHAIEIYSTEEINEIKYQAGLLLEGLGEIEEAANLYIEVSNWDKLTQLISLNAEQLITQGRYIVIKNWISQFPETYLNNNAWLNFWLGAGNQAFDVSSSRNSYKKALSLFKKENNSLGAYLSWVGAVDTFFYVLGDFSLLDYWLNEFNELRNRWPKYPSQEIEARVVYGMFGALLWHKPDHDEMSLWMNKAKSLIQQDVDINCKVMIANYLILYCIWWKGSIEDASFTVNSIKHKINMQGIQPMISILWQVMLSLHCWVMNSHETGLKHVDEGFKEAQSSGVYLVNLLLHSQGIYNCLISGNTKLANTHIDNAENILRDIDILSVAHHHYLIVWVALADNDIQRASEHANYTRERAIASGAPIADLYSELSLAEISIELKDFEEAKERLNHIHSNAKEMSNNYLQYHCLLSYSRICFEQDNEVNALEYLREALSFGEEQGYIAHPWIGWRRSVLSKLYVKALENNINSNYVHEIIRKRNIIPETPPLHLENWPWAIQIYTLGHFTLIRDGEKVRFSGKVQKKPLEMLKAIIAFGGRKVAEDQITDALWSSPVLVDTFNGIIPNKWRCVYVFPEVFRRV